MAYIPSENTWRDRPPEAIQVWSPEEYDLSGGVIVTPIWDISSLPASWGNRLSGGNTVLIIKKIIVLYTEATSADTPVSSGLRIGTNVNLNAVHGFNSEINKNVGDTLIIDQADFNAEARIDSAVNWVQIRSSGGKTGAGTVRIGLIISQDYSEWFGNLIKP